MDLDAIGEPAAAAVGDLGIADLVPGGGAADMRSRRRRTAHIALRALLLQRLEPTVARRALAPRPQGKPELPGSSIELSLSHSGHHALIGLSHIGAIGVDLEAPRAMPMSPPRREAIVNAGIAVGGGSPLPGGTESARTLAAWVRLEAVAKATGEGIGRLLTRLGTRPGHAPIVAAKLEAMPQALDLVLPASLVGAVATGSAVGLTGVPDVRAFAVEDLARAVSMTARV